MRATVHCTLLLLVALIVPVRAAADAAAVPSDFKLVAEYGPGLSAGKPWTVTIEADGTGVQKIYGQGASETSFTLPPDALADLWSSVTESRFFLLAGAYSPDVTDKSTLVLRVRQNEASHEVVVYAPRNLQGNEDVKRFLQVWNAVLRKVPSPNPEQRPQ
jgi:hypothetical protein